MPETPLNEMRWTTSEIATRTGIKAPTLFGWGDRYDFPTPSSQPGAQGGYERSFHEVVMIMLAAKLVGLGMQSREACSAASSALAAGPQIALLIEDLSGARPKQFKPISPLMAVDPAGENFVFADEKTLVGKIMRERDAMVIVNVGNVILDAMTRFGIKRLSVKDQA